MRHVDLAGLRADQLVFGSLRLAAVVGELGSAVPTEEGVRMRLQASNVLIDVGGLAERLGVNVRYVRRLVAERRVPFIKLGHLIRFDPGEIDRWLDSSRIDRSA